MSMISDPTPSEIDSAIQQMERQIIDDSIKARLVPLDAFPPAIQEAIIRAMPINKPKG